MSASQPETICLTDSEDEQSRPETIVLSDSDDEITVLYDSRNQVRKESSRKRQFGDGLVSFLQKTSIYFIKVFSKLFI